MSLVERLVDSLIDWIPTYEGEPRIGKRKWFLIEEGDSYIKVYVRIGYHCLDGNSLSTCLDIASIEISPQKVGIFTSFIERLEELDIPYPLYVEEAVPFLGDFLVKRGWIRMVDQDNYYLIKQEN